MPGTRAAPVKRVGEVSAFRELWFYRVLEKLTHFSRGNICKELSILLLHA